MWASPFLIALLLVAPATPTPPAAGPQSLSDVTVLKHSLYSRRTDNAFRGYGRYGYYSTTDPAELKWRAPNIVTSYESWLTVRNVGAKKIDAVAWDVVVTDAASGSEIARYQFARAVRLRPGGKGTFSHTFTPTRAEDDRLAAAGKKAAPAPAERVVVTCLRYADGTFRPGAPADEASCRRLARFPRY